MQTNSPTSHERRCTAPTLMRCRNDTSTMTAARHKKQRKNTQDPRQRPHPVLNTSREESNHHRAHERFMSNYYQRGPLAAPHPRTPVRPPSAHRRQLVSPPMPHRITCQEQQHRQPQHHERRQLPPPQVQYRISHRSTVSIVGNPSLGIFRICLPRNLLYLLDQIVLGCEAHAATLPTGWHTDLYSLTKQDIALREVPHLYEAAQPIVLYIKKCMMKLWRVSRVAVDRNQPHILKYDEGHLGVELHHDKCDITANLCLSRTTSYVGGGTTFPDASSVVRLDFGEFILHPGGLIHGGRPIQSGTRHLMVIFAHVRK